MQTGHVIGLSRQQSGKVCPNYDDSILLDSAYEEQLKKFILPRLESANPIAAQILLG